MRNQHNRLKKMYVELPTEQRTLMALDALAGNDDETVGELCRTAPRKAYTTVEAEFADTMDAASEVSLRFDRWFYRLQFELHRALCIKFIRERECPEVERANAVALAERDADAQIDQIHALVIGTEVFAGRLGLSFDRVLAFSAVADVDRDELEKYLRAPEPGLDRLQEQIREVADALEELWKKSGRAISRFS